MMNNIVVSLDEKGQPLINSTSLYASQGVINVGDYNFDGHEDFGVQNGNNGAYNSPSYDIYLYSSERGVFEISRPMTELIAFSLGFFQVDPSKKLLTTMIKDGCCYHETTRYAVVSNHPIPVFREIDDASKSDKYDLVIDQRMVAGRWTKMSEKRIPQTAP